MKTQELIDLRASITQGGWRQSQADPLTVLTGLGDNQTTLARVFRPCLSESKHDAQAIALVPQLLDEVIKLREALQRINDDMHGAIKVAALDGKERLPSLIAVRNIARASLLALLFQQSTELPMNSEQIWEKAQCFAADFRQLVRRYIPDHYAKTDETNDLIYQMQDRTSCFSPAVWDKSEAPKTPTELVLFVNYAGDRAAGLRSMTDTLRISCESGDWGGAKSEFEEFIKGAVSEWYDGAHVASAEVHQEWHDGGEVKCPIDLERVQRLIDRLSKLNPEAGEIGDGMLRSLVTEARELTN